MGNSKFGAFVLIAIVGLSVAAWQAALVDGAQPTSINDESIFMEVGGQSDVSEDGVTYSDTVTITNNGSTLSEGEDYQWHPRNGTVSWYATENTESGQLASIDYTVYRSTDQTQSLIDVYSFLPFIGALLVTSVLFLGVLATVGVSWGS